MARNLRRENSKEAEIMSLRLILASCLVIVAMSNIPLGMAAPVSVTPPSRRFLHRQSPSQPAVATTPGLFKAPAGTLKASVASSSLVEVLHDLFTNMQNGIEVFWRMIPGNYETEVSSTEDAADPEVEMSWSSIIDYTRKPPTRHPQSPPTPLDISRPAPTRHLPHPPAALRQTVAQSMITTAAPKHQYTFDTILTDLEAPDLYLSIPARTLHPPSPLPPKRNSESFDTIFPEREAPDLDLSRPAPTGHPPSPLPPKRQITNAPPNPESLDDIFLEREAPDLDLSRPAPTGHPPSPLPPKRQIANAPPNPESFDAIFPEREASDLDLSRPAPTRHPPSPLPPKRQIANAPPNPESFDAIFPEREAPDLDLSRPAPTGHPPSPLPPKRQFANAPPNPECFDAIFPEHEAPDLDLSRPAPTGEPPSPGAPRLRQTVETPQRLVPNLQDL